MGTCIEAAATAHPGRLLGRGARHLTDAAARACLERAHHDGNDLDLLVHAGIYKDHHVAQPALAAIVQEDVGANPGSPPELGHHGTFSFDVLDGGCGVITAASIVDAFVGRGGGRLAMIVAADADPSPRTSHGFPFAPAGGAVIVSHVDGARGFVRFAKRTFPEYAGLFEAHLRWDPHAGLIHRGRNVLEVYEAPAFAQTCVDSAVVVVRELLADAELAPAQVDLLIASQYPDTFARQLALALGIPDARVPAVAPELVRSHTAGPIAALESALVSRRFTRARNVLFVACGAGLAVAAALYRG